MLDTNKTSAPLSRACDCCGFQTLALNLIDNERAGIKCVECSESCSESCADRYTEGERKEGVGR